VNSSQTWELGFALARGYRGSTPTHSTLQIAAQDGMPQEKFCVIHEVAKGYNLLQHQQRLESRQSWGFQDLVSFLNLVDLKVVIPLAEYCNTAVAIRPWRAGLMCSCEVSSSTHLGPAVSEHERCCEASWG